VLAMRRAGAVCVDLYSAFVYQGWTVARDINLALLAMFEQAADKDGSMLRSTQLREPQRA
jgi:dihydroorotate dehydrogenase